MNFQAMGSFSANISAVFPPSPQTREFRQTTVWTTVVDPSQWRSLDESFVPCALLCWSAPEPKTLHAEQTLSRQHLLAPTTGGGESCCSTLRSTLLAVGLDLSI